MTGGGYLTGGGYFVKEGGKLEGGGATGISAYISGGFRDGAVTVLMPGVGNEGSHSGRLFPTGGNTGLGIKDNAGHSAVFLANPKDGAA